VKLRAEHSGRQRNAKPEKMQGSGWLFFKRRYVHLPFFKNPMNVEVENLPNCLTTLRVELPPEKVSQTWDKIAREYTQYAKLPGYRPGKAPRTVVENKFKKEIREELQKQLLSESCREAISEKKLRVISLAEVQDVEFGDDKTMRFTATLVTQPEFELPDYKSIAVQLKPTDVTEQEIDDSLNNLRDQYADFSDVTDRPLALDDFAVIDYTGTIDGKPVSEVAPKAGKPLSGNTDFWIKLTPEAFFKGFADNLVGAAIGESRTFDIGVPADFPVTELAGQKITYAVTVKNLKAKNLPELNDEFAGKVVEGKTLAELRDLAKSEIEAQKKHASERDKRDQIMHYLLSKVECELPANLVRSETQRILADIVRENQNRGISDEMLKGNEKEIVDNAAKGARERLRGSFVLLRIAEQENIKITKEEFDERIDLMASRYQMPREKLLKELSNRGALDQVQEEILTGKTLDFLASNASVQAAA
jgi:trigger factor